MDEIRIVVDKKYAKKMQLTRSFLCLNNEIAIDFHHNLDVRPRYDYLQLTNI
jgi:hypothetical protein